MKLSVRNPWVLLPLLAVSMSLQQCSCSDIMGALFVSEQDELTLGAEFNRQLLDSSATYPVFKTNNVQSRVELQTYLNSCFAKVHDAIPASDRTGYHDQFKFTIIDSDVSNAFAVPGGYVYIYTGILKDMKSESELMGVLGHEMAHVTRHHYRDALAQQVGISLLIETLTGNAGQVTQFVGNMFGSLMSMRVSQANEYEADETGTRYLAYAGRNPMGIADFFARMKDAGLTWFSTHPASSDRVDKVRAEVNGDAALKALATDEKKYSTQYVSTVCAANGTSKIDYCPN